MSLTERKAGGTSPDADDFNAVVDAVVALQAASGGSQPTIYTGEVPVNPSGTEFSLAGSSNTSGTFTLTFGSETTAPIAFDAGSQDIADALNVLASVGFTVNVAEGFEGLFLNVDQIRFVFTGALIGPTDAPTVTDDTTDNGVQADTISTGDAGDPVGAVQYDLYVSSSQPFVYVFDSAAWMVTKVGNSAIATANIENLAVTSDKIANGAIGSSKMGQPVLHVNHDGVLDALIDALVAGNVMAPGP